jgi:kinesin family protein 4/21/27
MICLRLCFLIMNSVLSQVVPNRPQISLGSIDRAFTYDFAFDEHSEQKTVYDTAVAPMIENLFNGYNATVLAYGQTGSGKTHSMGTTFNVDKTPMDLAGIIPRVVQDIFKEIENRKEELDVTVKVSFVELYREALYDLLSKKSSRKEDCICDLREDPVKGVIIPNLTENKVDNLRDTMNQLVVGSTKRVTAATAMNSTSSRSHAIFSLSLTIVNTAAEGNAATVSKFHLVDLAGSERGKKTKAEGQRQKEGIAINHGLLALGNVIAALGEENTTGKSIHIPYRNSKLTRLLQDSLGGNSYTLMLSCVGPADSNIEETLCTLRYSDRARNIKNKPIVNIDGNDAEMNRLRLENQELRMQLRQGGPAADNTSQEELKSLQENNKKLRDENRELTSTLVSCQAEMAHLNEIVILHENSGNTLKTKMKEMVAELAVRCENNKELQELQQKMAGLLEIKNEADRTIMAHDLTRADMSNISEDGEDLTDDVFVKEHHAKSSELTNQLMNLNKMLAQKERLASAMEANEEQLQKLNEKHEKDIVSLETEIANLQKEKSHLKQTHRNAGHDPTSKIAEQRRKRIQELEQKLTEVNRKLMEAQKAKKMNDKANEKAKKLSEEIMQMKQSKVKLIKQIKEDAEKFRVFKQEKEREVMRLKQAERKQQAKMAKMENLHTKQQNVLRRKMEEAFNVNKRLKDALEKQKASKFKVGKGGMAGAGERVRNWLNEELDVVISVKEAVQSREQLLNDRKTLTKELNQIKKGMRETMSGEDMAENQRKVESLQSDLDLRNAQLAQLQKQISDLEQDGSSKARFDDIRSLAEAKIALEHAFEKSVDTTFYNGQLKSEMQELKQLYDECVKNTNILEKEIAGMKHTHQTELMKLSREHEDKVLFLLSKMSNTTESERCRIQDEEIRKYSKLNDELLKMGEENEKLRREQMMNKENQAQQKPVGPSKKKRLSSGERYTMEEFFEKDNDSEEEASRNEMDDSMDSDPDWVKTPLFKRIRRIRESTIHGAPNNRRKDTLTVPQEEDEDSRGPAPKRMSGNTSMGGCKCKTGCGSKRCACKKKGPVCNESCGCDPNVCRNRQERSEDSSSNSNDDTANTMSLLNDTYNISVLAPPSTSPARKRSLLAADTTRTIIKSPLKENVNHTYFKSPIASDDDDDRPRKAAVRF